MGRGHCVIILLCCCHQDVIFETMIAVFIIYSYFLSSKMCDVAAQKVGVNFDDGWRS